MSSLGDSGTSMPHGAAGVLFRNRKIVVSSAGILSVHAGELRFFEDKGEVFRIPCNQAAVVPLGAAGGKLSTAGLKVVIGDVAHKLYGYAGLYKKPSKQLLALLAVERNTIGSTHRSPIPAASLGAAGAAGAVGGLSAAGEIAGLTAAVSTFKSVAAARQERDVWLAVLRSHGVRVLDKDPR